MENRGAARARLAGAASRPNAPGGGPLGNRVRERVVSGFQDARRRLVERDRRSRRRPVICGRREFRQSERRQALRRRLENSEPPIWGPHFLHFLGPNTHTAFLFPSPPKKYTANERRERFPEISGLRPGGRRGSEWSSRCRRCLSERARRSRGHFPGVVRSRRDPASVALARVRG